MVKIDSMVIDPKLQTCSCGYSFTPSLFMKLVMLVRGEYVKRCPRCQAKLTFVLVSHVVKVDTKVVKGKERLWRYG